LRALQSEFVDLNWRDRSCAEVADCVFEEIVSEKTDSIGLRYVLSAGTSLDWADSQSYIAALEERCAQLESAIIQVNPLHEAVQDHLGSVKGVERLGTPERDFAQSRQTSRAPMTMAATRTKRLERPETLGSAQNEEQLESTIRDYLEDLSAKAFAETPYVGELSGMTFAKLAKA
jgi:hypothetical protein